MQRFIKSNNLERIVSYLTFYMEKMTRRYQNYWNMRPTRFEGAHCYHDFLSLACHIVWENRRVVWWWSTHLTVAGDLWWTRTQSYHVQCHQHSYLVVQLEHPVVDGDLVKLEEAAGGLGDDVQNIRHDSCQLRHIIWKDPTEEQTKHWSWKSHPHLLWLKRSWRYFCRLYW